MLDYIKFDIIHLNYKIVIDKAIKTTYIIKIIGGVYFIIRINE